MDDFSSRRPAQETSRDRRDIGDLPTRLLDPSAALHPPHKSAGPLPDIGSLPTGRLTLPPGPPARTPAVSERLHTGPTSRQFPGAEEYEQEAQQLHEQAQRIEQWMWQLSEQLRHAHAHYQHLRTTSGPAAIRAPDQAREQMRVGHDMAALVRQIDRARAEYIAIMKQAQGYIEIADQLRRGGNA